jgi:methyltransferase (TIGR00027 family)
MGKAAAIQSAQTVAMLRAAVTNDTELAVPCEDRLAKYFIGMGERFATAALPQPLLRWMIESVSPGSYGFAIARTRCFDDALLSEAASGIEQVVILGAGYDSRALRFARELKKVRVFEVDHPGTQARKMDILLRSITDIPRNVQYVSVDFNRGTLEKALVDKGFSRNRRTLFLWEGVSYYLPREVVGGILDFVKACAPGSSIVFDYALRTFVEGDTSTYGGERIAEWLRKIGEPFLFGLNAQETPHFLAEHGLQPVYDIGPEDAEALYLTRKDGSVMRRTLGHVRIVHARTA